MNLVDRYYDFNHYEKHLQSVISQIEESGIEYFAIFGISKGGIVPAVHMSYILNLPFFTLEWSKRRPDTQDKSNEHLLNFLKNEQNVLLVDHATLSGETFFRIKQNYYNSSHIHFVSLVCEKQENLPYVFVNYKGVSIDRQNNEINTGIRWWFKERGRELL